MRCKPIGLTLGAASIREGHSERVSSLAPESEDDVYGGHRGRTFAKKRRQKMSAASGRGTPVLSEVRFSTRRAAKVATYNEDDNLGLSEEDTEMTPNYYYTEEPQGPAIDVVLNHRLKEGAGMCSHRPNEVCVPD